ncbi:MAG: LuxR C-terminal-related transcriptional regulator, partial [Mucinivorans sp.]
ASKEIAMRLGISKNTVDRHRQNIMEKLRVNSAIEALKVAKSLGVKF